MLTFLRGTAIYAFLGGSIANSRYEIDNTGSHLSLLADSGLFTETGLTYSNDSLPNGTHTLVITGSDMAFDSVIYTYVLCPWLAHEVSLDDRFDDGQTAGLPAPSQSSSSSTISTSPSETASSSVIPVVHHKPPIGGIVGGVLGGLVLLAVVIALTAMLKCRSRRRLGRNTPRPIFLGDKDEVDPRPDAQSSPDTAALAEQIRVLQAQTAQLQLTLRAQHGSSTASSADTRGASVKRGQTGSSVPEEAPRLTQADLVMHTDSGVRFAPARQPEAKEVPPDYTPE